MSGKEKSTKNEAKLALTIMTVFFAAILSYSFLSPKQKKLFEERATLRGFNAPNRRFLCRGNQLKKRRQTGEESRDFPKAGTRTSHFIAKIQGIVLNESQKPVCGATLCLYDRAEGLKKISETYSKPDGTFVFSDLKPFQHWRLVTSKVGYLTDYSRPTPFVFHKVILSPGIPCVGQVRDLATGLPISRAYVYIRGSRMPAETGTDGKFLLHVPPGVEKVELHFSCTDYYPTTKQLEKQNDVRYWDAGQIFLKPLEEPKKVSLIVFSEDAGPLPNVRVTLGCSPRSLAPEVALDNELIYAEEAPELSKRIIFGSSNVVWIRGEPQPNYERTTDMHGECEIKALPPDYKGFIVFFLIPPLDLADARTVILPYDSSTWPEESKEFAVLLSKGRRRWEGIVTDCRGQAVANCKVKVSVRTRQGDFVFHKGFLEAPIRIVNSGPYEVAYTDLEGHFATSIQFDLPLLIEASHPGMGSKIMLFLDNPPEGQRIFLKFKDGADVFVRLAGDSFVEAVQLKADPKDFLAGISISKEGTLIRCVPPGKYSVFGVDFEQGWKVDTELVVNAVEESIDFVISPQKLSYLHCRFVLTEKSRRFLEELSGRVFYLEPAPPMWVYTRLERSAELTREGELVFYLVVPGKYMLSVRDFDVNMQFDERTKRFIPMIHEIYEDGQTIPLEVLRPVRQIISRRRNR
ncbi:MAG: hypothetical protein DRI26_07575 [Chloroflexi bacterium]|nr:MAG: hypothetical protein DRI26_07575 [Chloroflexota bacterium]